MIKLLVSVVHVDFEASHLGGLLKHVRLRMHRSFERLKRSERIVVVLCLLHTFHDAVVMHADIGDELFWGQSRLRVNVRKFF